jgi:hypothetical protein
MIDPETVSRTGAGDDDPTLIDEVAASWSALDAGYNALTSELAGT